MKTKNIFVDKKIFGYRDSDIDNWLPENQVLTPGTITMIELKEEMTFKEMFDKYKGEVCSLVDIEKLIKENDERLLTNGYTNFFFVEDKDGGISVVYVFRDGGRWYVSVNRLGYDHRWGVGYRIFIRNLNLSSSTPLTLESEPIYLEQRVQKLEEYMEKLRKFLII